MAEENIAVLVANSHPPRLELSQPGSAALVQAVIDPIVVLGVLIACVLWFDGKFGAPYLILSLIVFPMTFPAGLSRGAPHGGPNFALERAIVTGWLAVAGLLLMLGWATQTLDVFDQGAILAWLVATPFALIGAHRLAPLLLARLLWSGRAQRTAVIAGANEVGHRLAERIRAEPLLGVRVAGFFDDRDTHRTGPIGPGEDLGALSRLAEYVKQKRIDIIYIALPMASQPRVRRLLEELHDTTASIYFVPDVMLFDLIQARVDAIGGLPVLAVCESPFYGWNAVVKRASDLVLASLVLLFAGPLMLAIAALIRLESPGPALFRQRRYGLDGREIVVYKFRSMTVLEDGAVIRQATRDDKRVTRLGAFLRASSLDELPQFLNVLQGRMSVVGPRPHAIAHNEMYRKRIRGYMIRHKVRPGITGLAQVNGLRGETDTLEKMEARIEQDLAYLRNWSLLLDLKIVALTVLVVLGRRNAY
ncbi:MAG TPA: undecaprenyl-phosphate glucose phosphotransferase [Burkholderiales bacterium]|nr:undecaprenyl-phosphate glucose phosphotransferase [Burkholderiales bacterium]